MINYQARSPSYSSTSDSDEEEITEEGLRAIRSNATHPLIQKKASDLSTSIQLITSDNDSLINEEDEEEDSSNPFIDTKLSDYYSRVYETSQYECRHLFDPNFNWSKHQDKIIVHKLDKVIALFACLMFTGLQLDRGNLPQAISDNMLEDLNLTTNDYNRGNTIFLICFLLGEIPSSILSKWIGADRFIPFQMITWSIVASCQCFLQGKYSFFLARALTAVLESGLIAELVLFLSTYYKAKELPIRLSWLWVTSTMVQVCGAVMAMGILRLRGFLGWEGWRWLFLIEGLITLVIGVGAIYMLIPSPIELVDRGWFTEHEVKIIVNRVLRDDPTKGDTNNRSGVTLKQLVRVFLDYDLWPIYLVGLIAYIPASSIGTYIPIIYRGAGLTTFQTNLLLIPHYILHITFLLQITKLSERFNQRALVAIILPIYSIPLLFIFKYNRDRLTTTGLWLLSSLIAGAPYIHAICVSWVSRNSGSIKTRSVSAAVYNLIVQAGGIISANIYRDDDKPLYHRGNTHILLFGIALLPLLLSIKAYYTWRNNSKSKVWNSMTEDEQYQYVHNTPDEGNKRLDFRFDS
ncbi:allantoate permease [Scheffersomyces coipomensis]|uniref:allantoate permease n=1 Tax=Scheffersomyces coipomensis TaxID=1788519 RepID=UPI00315DDFCD